MLTNERQYDEDAHSILDRFNTGSGPFGVEEIEDSLIWEYVEIRRREFYVEWCKYVLEYNNDLYFSCED